MDRLERYNDSDGTLIRVLKGNQSEIWTALPGIVQKFDPVEMTCSVQPSVQICRLNVGGEHKREWINIPLLTDCPIHFPSGGGATLTFPVTIGDECLVVFSSRCIDAWWQNGGHENQQPIMRMHDLSDGFVFVGFRSQVRLISNVSTTAVQLRSDSGSTIIELNPNTEKVSITAPAGVEVIGNLTVTGTITASGDITGEGTSLHTHHHSGVTTGGGNTGAPV